MRNLRNNRSGIAAALIAVAAIVIVGGVVAAYLLLPGIGDQGPYAFKEGNFVEYDLDYQEDPSVPHSNMTLRIEVMSITTDTMTLNYTQNLSGYLFPDCSSEHKSDAAALV